MQNYINSAESLIDLSFKNRAGALNILPGFLNNFKELEGELEALGDSIEKDIQNLQANSLHTSSQGQWIILLVHLLPLIGLMTTSLWIVKSVRMPLNQAVTLLQGLADGDLQHKLTIESNDEFGSMAQAFNQSIEKSMSSTLRTIKGAAGALTDSSSHLSLVSGQMNNNAGTTSSQALMVSAAAEQISSNVQTVAAGPEEMSASIKEISRNVAEATRVTGSAVEAAETTNKMVSRLGESSAKSAM